MNNEIEEEHEELKNTFYEQHHSTTDDSSAWENLGGIVVYQTDVNGYYRVHLANKNESYIKGPNSSTESTLLFKEIEGGYVCVLRLTGEEIAVIKKHNTEEYFVESSKYKLNGHSVDELMRFIGSVNLEGQ